MRPSGRALDWSLKNARFGEDGWGVWEEEDHFNLPLVMERKAALDPHFEEIGMEKVNEEEG